MTTTRTTDSAASLISAARARRALSADAAANALALLARADCTPLEAASIADLAAAEAWGELDDRFFRRLRFGTGGLRGRTIGRVVAPTEQGARAVGTRPEHPAVGVNCLNHRAVADATRGLVRYLRQVHGRAPVVVVAHDTRHFSPEFARTTADVVVAEGGTAFLYDAPASTPQLAFTVRARRADAGVVITASHNPPHDNGYKIYLADGSQIVEPAASGIAAAIETARDEPQPAGPAGALHLLTDADDEPFLEAMRAESSTAVAGASGASGASMPVRIVYTPLHGTGIRIIPRALERAGIDVTVVAEQAAPDGAFPTVPSPNPEDPRVYERALARAREIGADVVVATDPDADRLGIAVRAPGGDYALLTGNQVGALLAEFRLTRLFDAGVLTRQNAAHAAIVKTYVTTDLIAAIAAHHGVRCVETLTGFKYIGAKLRAYAQAARGDDGLQPLLRADALARSTYLVLGCEESFGYLAGDYVRDKDANGAALMLAELVADVARRGGSVLASLDALYVRHGYFADRLATLPFEGQRGATEMAALLESYRRTPPSRLAGVDVREVQDFAAQRIVDADGEPVPAELMLRYTLADGGRVTVRGSGTEPKLKYYIALRAPVSGPDALADVRRTLDARLDAVWTELQADVAARVRG